jgi:hypothetical protein
VLDSVLDRIDRWRLRTAAASDRRAWLRVFALVLPVFLFTAHFAMVSVDTSSAFVPAWHLVHHGNLWLEGMRHPPYWSIHSGGHLVSNRTPGVILVNVPAYLLLFFLGPVPLGGALTAAGLTAATVATLYLVVRRLSSPDAALATALVAALGTSLWSIASAEIWTHTVDAFCLGLAMLFLTRGRHLAAGVVIGVGTTARPHLIVIAVVLGLYLAAHHRSLRPAVAVGLGSAPGFATLLVLNHAVFGRWTLSGYGSYVTQSLTSAGGATGHGGALASAERYVSNAAGFLVSPLCGLLLYLPVALLLIAGFRPAWRAAPAWCRGMLLGGMAYTLVQLKINSYVGGAAFYGYRLATELVVCAAPLAVFAYKEWAVRRPWRTVTAKALAVLSVVIQAVGVTCYDIARSAPVKPWPSDFVAAYGHRPAVATAIVIGGIAAAWLWISRQTPRHEPEAVALTHEEGATPRALVPVGSAG